MLLLTPNQQHQSTEGKSPQEVLEFLYKLCLNPELEVCVWGICQNNQEWQFQGGKVVTFAGLTMTVMKWN